MTPTSTHSVTVNGALGNTPDTVILSSLTEITRSLEEQGIHDEARALHDLLPNVRRTLEHARIVEENNRRWREQWEHTCALFERPNSDLSATDKLILWRLRGEALRRRDEGIAGPHPILIGDIETERGTVPGLASTVGMSAGQVGKRLKAGAEACGAIRRTEDKDPDTGRTRILIEFTDAYWDPTRLKRDQPRNQGGRRKPRCPDHPQADILQRTTWACSECGQVLDVRESLVHPDDPESPPPTSNLTDHVDPQWGGDSNQQFDGWSPKECGVDHGVGAIQVVEVSAPAGCEGEETLADTPTGKLTVGPGGVDGAGILKTQEGGQGADGQLVARLIEDTGDVDEVIPEYDLSAGVPQELREHPQWVAWRLETTPDGRCVKPPYRPSNPRKRADVMDPGTWGTYEEALAVSGEDGGVGYVLTGGDPYSVIDLDGCRDPETGEIEPAAAEVVRLLDSYTEISPSGKGLHVWLRGRIPGKRRRSGKLEMYDRARYVTVTGHVLPRYTEIRERQEELGELYRRTFGDTGGSARAPLTKPPGQVPSAGDEEIIARVLADSEGRRLWAGDTSLHNNDSSRADLALLNRLARYTGDPERLDRLFRKSGLYRPKWERADYREKTINRALSGRPAERDGSTPTVEGSVLSDLEGLQEGW